MSCSDCQYFKAGICPECQAEAQRREHEREVAERSRRWWTASEERKRRERR